MGSSWVNRQEEGGGRERNGSSLVAWSSNEFGVVGFGLTQGGSPYTGPGRDEIGPPAYYNPSYVQGTGLG